MSILNQKTVCIVTGASRGIGEAIALQLPKHLGTGSMLVLLARSLDDLQRVQDKALQLLETIEKDIKVAIKRYDQGSVNKEDFDTLLSSILKEYNVTDQDFHRAVMIHNAGTLDQTKFCKNLDNLSKINQYLQINLAGMITMNAKFLQTFSNNQKIIVNLSSVAAVEPLSSWGLHCAIKSGRDMFFKTLALESPAVRVLNYGPGPVKTNTATIVLNQSEDPEVRQLYTQKFKENNFLSPETTACKLIKILEQNEYDNGAHIDYHDV